MTQATLSFFDKTLALTAILCFIVHFTAMLKNLEDKDAFWPKLAWAMAQVSWPWSSMSPSPCFWLMWWIQVAWEIQYVVLSVEGGLSLLLA